MKRLLLLSGKGGTGKTTTAAAFLHFSRTTAAADCDVDAPNLHLLAALSGAPQKIPFFGGEKAQVEEHRCIGCGQCLAACRFDAISQTGDRIQISSIACEGCGVCARVCPQDAISLLPDQAGTQQLYTSDGTFSTAELKMGRGTSGKLVSAVKLALFKNAPPEEELAILDGSPGIGCPVMASLSGVDLALIVAEPSLSGLSDLQRLVRSASALEAKLAVCINKWDVSPEQSAAIEAYCRAHDIPLCGRIPYDSSASAAINQGLSLAQVDCPARDALWQVYQNTRALLGLHPKGA